MFKLQRLEITGFKSFANHTEIIFDDGITAIVGPNGCGKSNIFEAICWALGEQRAKLLRSNEMQDIIFQGTNSHPPASMAEVTLHLLSTKNDISEEIEKFDESIQKLNERNDSNIERKSWKPYFQNLQISEGETVSITRRLFRSGESEYLLNGKPCRLRDIQDLFSGTGLGNVRYAIIEQGYIGQILSAKPSERRALIEEAAGISKFRMRQKTAEARLETARTNLTRINDIIREVETQVSSLRRQALKAERYKNLKEALRQNLRKIYTIEGISLINFIEQARKELEKIEDSEKLLLEKIEEQKDLLSKTKSELYRVSEDLKELENLRVQNIIQKKEHEKEIENRKEQIKSLSERLESIRREKNEAEVKIRTLESELQSLRQKETLEIEEQQKHQMALRQVELLHQKEAQTVKLLEEELKKKEIEKRQHILALEHLKSLYRQNESTVEKLIERREGLIREGERADKNFHEHSKEISVLTDEIKKQDKIRQSTSAELESLIEKESKERQLLNEIEENLYELRQRLSQNQLLLKNLKELESTGKIYAPAVQKVFAEQEKIGVKLAGILADKLNVHPEVENIVENIFGSYLQTLLVETVSQASKLIKYIDENEIGRVSILIVPEKIESKNDRENSSLIDQLLGTTENLSSIMKEVFAREASAKLVESISPESSNGEVLVDRKGNLSVCGKLFIVGKHKKDDFASILFFKRRIRELQLEIESLSEAIKQKETLAAKAKGNLENLSAEINSKKAELDKTEKQILSLSVRLDSLEQEIKRTERHKNVVAEELKQLGADLIASQEKFEEISLKVKNAEETLEKSNQEASELQKKLEKFRKSLTEILTSLNQKKTAAQIAEERHKITVNTIRRIEAEFSETRKRLIQLDAESKDNEAKQKALIEEISEIEKKLLFQTEKISKTEQEISQTKSKFEELNHENERINAILEKSNDQFLKLKEERSRIEIKIAEAEADLKNLNEKCLRELNKPLSELIRQTEEIVDSELNEAYVQAEQIRQKLENLGTVNLLAQEELIAAEERLKFLINQRNDISEGIKDAQEALSEIKSRSKERFIKAFEIINSNFTKLFSDLFGGGTGELRLIETDEILESGIEIIAQPPGKRLQNVLLLSGGEKAMTAIALMLAIFEFQPSPFCILDEVDAPLDDSNISRFIEKLRQMASEIQFLIITHNKKTMEAADRLYGVTMQEKGVSKIVSVDLKRI
ncbi:MAG: chromosome segregation protein SMC [Pyrinomonadaceae bacterium]|nr:chromosome segregation protein SMC [Pyrinomonadaceae bacterium]MCX7640424.1 chromosome segregation protein SMC [Pyrinomonadaceae bacterium]MDW8304851.1 chromosome segregation protein SMC [Acidobacteriota bacterium]